MSSVTRADNSNDNRLSHTGRLVGVLCALLGSAVTFAPSPALAEPHPGIGLFGGLVAHEGNVQLADGEVVGFTSSGVDAGLEYQWLFSPEYSLAAYADGSDETVAGDASTLYSSVSHGYLGAQFRYWEGSKFVGAQAGVYSETLFAKSGAGTSQTQGNGWAYGVSGGYEWADGWFLVAQVDLGQVAFTNASHGLSALRANLGYRWSAGPPPTSAIKP